jgi:hypothetical protein
MTLCLSDSFPFGFIWLACLFGLGLTELAWVEVDRCWALTYSRGLSW